MSSDRIASCVAVSTVRMRAFLATVALLVICGASDAVRAEDSGNFIVTLGRDTTAVEHYTRTPARVEVDQIGRTPRVLRRHITYEFADGAVKRFAMAATAPNGTTPTQTIDGSFDADSVRLTTKSGASPAQSLALALPKGTVVVTYASPWVGYEGAIMKLVQSKQDSLQTPLWFVGARGTSSLTLHKVGRDSVELTTDRGDDFRVRIDAAGRILGVKPIAGTGQFAVQRVAHLGLDAMAATYAAREQAGAGLGVLSPRDTLKVADIAGASLTIDYGRPAKRGRVIFGGVVPYGKVWRTGANAATQFKTDKAIDFGGMIVPAGSYTLWTLPAASGWKLIVNSETGQWGTEYKPEKDLGAIDMQVKTVSEPVERFTISVEPAPQGGVLHFDWDTTRASAAFVVQR